VAGSLWTFCCGARANPVEVGVRLVAMQLQVGRNQDADSWPQRQPPRRSVAGNQTRMPCSSRQRASSDSHRMLEQILARNHRNRPRRCSARPRPATSTPSTSPPNTLAEPEVVANLDQSPDLVRSGLTREPAWPTLRDHQVLLVMKVLGGPDGYNGRPLDEAHAHLDIDRSAAAGADPVTELLNAAATRELTSAGVSGIPAPSAPGRCRGCWEVCHRGGIEGITAVTSPPSQGVIVLTLQAPLSSDPRSR
jgi:hypothetical protein